MAHYLDNDLKYLQLQSLTDLSLLKTSGLQVVSITSDGKQGLIKAVKQVFPEAVHQRCIIHIQRMSLIYLTRFPKTDLKNNLKTHRGLTKKNRRNFILWYNYFKYQS